MDIIASIVGGIILVFIGLVIELVFFEYGKDVWKRFDEETTYRYKSYLLMFSIGCIGLGIFFILLGLVFNIFS